MRLFLLLIALPLFAQGPNSFFDHFTGTTLNSRWASSLAGQASIYLNGTKISGGTVTCPANPAGSSILEICANNAAVNTDAAIIYNTTTIDKTRSQTWSTMLNWVAGGGTSDHLILYDNGGATPVVDTLTNVRVHERFNISYATGGVEIFKFDASHTQTCWDGGSSSWLSCPAFATPTSMTADMYYEIGFEVDSANARIRLFAKAYDATFGTSSDNTPTMSALTDWVLFSNIEASDHMYFCLSGDPFTNSSHTSTFVEWVRMEDGTAHYKFANGRANSADTYHIRGWHGYDGVDGYAKTWIPFDRSTNIAPDGKDPKVLQDGSTCYMVYDNGGINLAKASSACTDGTSLSNVAGNPIVSNPGGHSKQFPVLIKDLDEPDSTKLWKIVYSDLTNASLTAIMAMVTCAGPPDTCTWSSQSQILAAGPAQVTITSNALVRSGNVVTVTVSNSFTAGVPVWVAGVTCPTTSPTGTFTLASATGSAFTYNQTGANETCAGTGTASQYDQGGYWGATDVVRAGGINYVYLAAHNGLSDAPAHPFYMTHATGPFLNLAKSNVIDLMPMQSGSCKTNITANITSSRVVTVTDTTGCVADQMVMGDQDTTADNNELNRILSVDNSTQLTLYHRWDGFTTTTPAQIRSAPAWTGLYPSFVRQIKPDVWSLDGTCFQQYNDISATIGAYREVTCHYTASSPVGPWTEDYLGTPTLNQNTFGFDLSAENVTEVHLPIPAQPRARVSK